MKKYISLIVYPLFVFFSTIPLFGMDSNSSQAIFDKRRDKVSQVIDKAQKGGFVGLETPFFSDTKIVKSLCNAAKRGADVEVHVASRSKANRQVMEDAGVLVKEIPGLHAKRCLVSSYNPRSVKRVKSNESDDGNETTVLVGSDNLSVCSQFHREGMTETKNDKRYFDQNVELFGTPKAKPREKKVMKITPVRRSVIGSRDYRLNETKGLRLAKLAREQNTGNSVDITSMTFDDDTVVSEIENVYKECEKENRPKTRLFLDSSALNHIDLLNRVKKAGGNDTSIHIFNEDKAKKVFDKFPQIQHTKTLTRECNGKKLSVISTGNLAKRSDTDFNVDSYHPDDEQLFSQIRDFNDTLEKESQEYTGS